MKIGIRGKMIGMFIALITIPLIALGIGSYLKTLSIIEKNLQELSSSTLKGIETSIDQYLNGYEENLNMIASNMDVKEIINHPEYEMFMMGIFKDFMESHKEVISIYLGTKDKIMFTYPEAQYEEGFDPTKRPWYEDAYEKNGISWTDPYMDVHTNKLVVSLSKPVYDQKDNFVGVVSVDISLDSLSNNVNKMKIGEDGYPFLVDHKGSLITHKNASKIGKPLETKAIAEAIKKDKKGTVEYVFKENGKDRKKISFFDTIEKTGWRIVGTLYIDDIMDRAKVVIHHTFLVGGISLLVVLLIAHVFSKYLTSRINILASNMEKVKSGDFTIRNTIKNTDEIGKLSEDFDEMIEGLSILIKNVQSVSYAVKESSESLRATAEETSATSEEVGRTVEEIAKGASSQAEEAQEGAILIGNLAQKLNNLGQETQEMFHSAENAVNSNLQAFEVVENLKEKTRLNNNATNKIEYAIGDLNTKLKAIGNILATITSIAQQTNLLALNASIEAARAGEHGKGFAVVADEIRKLAQGSDKATEEIKNIIGTIEENSANTVKIMDEVKTVSKEQFDSVSHMNTSFDEISKSIQIITQKITSINDFVEEMNQEKDLIVRSIENIAAVSQETAASSEEVSASMEQQTAAVEEVANAADSLNDLSMKLNEEIKQFKI